MSNGQISQLFVYTIQSIGSALERQRLNSNKNNKIEFGPYFEIDFL